MQKTFKKIWVIDGSFLLHRNLRVPELWELRSKKNGQRTGGIFGFLKSMNFELRRLDSYPVVMWDDGLSPRRTLVYDKYKNNQHRTASRLIREGMISEESSEEDIQKALKEILHSEDSVTEAINSLKEQFAAQKSEEYSKVADDDDYVWQYRRQRDVLISILRALGVPSVRIKDWEGDDLMAIVTRMAEQSVVMTDDKDLIQLIAPNIEIYRPIQGEHLRYQEYLEREDMKTSREMVIVKAIAGDGSDNIPSVTQGLERKYALGATRAKAVAKIILENEEDPERYLKILADTGKNYYRGFIENHANYLRNMQLVDLSLVENDPVAVNEIVSAVQGALGRANLMEALQLLGDQQIVNFDTNSCISRINLLSSQVMI